MKKINEINLDLCIYLGFVLLGLIVLNQSSNLRVASALFPQLLTYLMFFLCFLLVYFNFKSRKELQIEKTEKKKENITNKSNIKVKKINNYYEFYPIILVLICVLFLIGFQYIGFDLSSFIAMLVIMLFMNKKEALGKLYLAILVPFAIVLLFKYGLNLRLPLLIEKMF